MKTLNARVSSVILIALSAIFIFGFSAAFFTIPDKEVSENENRPLASAPEFSWESLQSGQFTSDVMSWFADQFPMRGFFVSLKGHIELLLGKQENNGIIYADDGYMIDRLTADRETIESNLASLSRLDSAVGISNGVSITVAVAPRKIDALPHLLPASLENVGDDTFSMISELCSEHSLTSVDLYSPLKDAAENGNYVYYKTDHHPTQHGAYLLYLALADTLGYTPYNADHFTVECVAEDFYGTTWSASATSGVSPDKIELYRYPGDNEYTVHIIDNDKTLSGFYDYDYLLEKDKYSLFLSGTNAQVTVTANGEARAKLLIINDSFANAVVPFLALHYDIELLDPRFLRQGLSDKINDGGYSHVLLLMNVDTLSSSELLSVISVGID